MSRVHVFLGSGGVGKTTLAAGTAMTGAMAGRRVVVLTVDPARRLADTLGLGTTDNEPRLVAGPWPGELWAAQLDPTATFATLLHNHGRPDQAQRVLDNQLFCTITESMSGINEYMAAERLHQLHHDGRFDQVVVDTPPSRHAIDFLDSPHRMVDFLDNRLYRTVLAPRSGVLRSVSSAAQLVLRLVGRLVGVDLVHDVIRLFSDLEGFDHGFRQRAIETSGLLAGPACRYTLVTSARAEPIREAAWIGRQLSERGLPVHTVIANRLTPFGRDTTTTAGRGAGRAALQENLNQLRAMAVHEDELLDELIDELGSGPTVIRLTERLRPLRSRDDLLDLAGQVVPNPVHRRARPRPLQSTR